MTDAGKGWQGPVCTPCFLPCPPSEFLAPPNKTETQLGCKGRSYGEMAGGDPLPQGWTAACWRAGARWWFPAGVNAKADLAQSPGCPQGCDPSQDCIPMCWHPVCPQHLLLLGISIVGASRPLEPQPGLGAGWFPH